MELHNQLWAGGEDIFIEIFQGSKSCHVKNAKTIKRGETKIWSNEGDLGSCSDMIFDADKNNISFVLRTTYKSLVWSNEFRPRKVTIKIGKATFSKDMNVWVDRKTVFLQTAKKGNFLKAFKTY